MSLLVRFDSTSRVLTIHFCFLKEGRGKDGQGKVGVGNIETTRDLTGPEEVGIRKINKTGGLCKKGVYRCLERRSEVRSQINL